MDENKLYQVALHLIPGLGPKTTKQLISYCGSAKAVLNTNKSKLLKIPGIGEKNATSILNSKDIITKSEKEIINIDNENAQILFYTDSNFPQKLKEQFDSPILLYYKGNGDLNKKRIVSIVGTRNATEYGKEITDKIIKDLASDDLIILSGLAYGIDIQAHKSSLTYNTTTVGVMASGIDKLYPSQHKATADKMLENGGLLTEEPFGSKPTAPKFPARNRIIAGMSDCTIVIEAAIKGGALITARIANSYNKDVFSVPGKVNSQYSEGTNFLIKNHEAHLISSADDVIKMMNWDIENTNQKPNISLDLNNFSIEEQRVLTALQNKNDLGIDELCWNTQIPMNEISTHLMTLEFGGIIKNLPGKKYKLLY